MPRDKLDDISSAESSSDDQDEQAESYDESDKTEQDDDGDSSSVDDDVPGKKRFHDDGSGKKPAHAYTIHSSIQLMKKEAKVRAQKAAAKLKKKGKRKEGQRVLVLSVKHCQLITDRVQKRLRSTNLPTLYRRTEDLCIGSMALVNQQRREDMVKRNLLSDKLKEQEDHLKQQLSLQEKRTAKARTNKELTNEELGVHPAIARFLGRTASVDEKPGKKRIKRGRYRPAPKGTMKRLLQKMTSEL